MHDHDDDRWTSQADVSPLTKALSNSRKARWRRPLVLVAALTVVALLVGALALYPVY